MTLTLLSPLSRSSIKGLDESAARKVRARFRTARLVKKLSHEGTKTTKGRRAGRTTFGRRPEAADAR
jgi:hypothetical protein